jgi:hypothetical protein
LITWKPDIFCLPILRLRKAWHGLSDTSNSPEARPRLSQVIITQRVPLWLGLASPPPLRGAD